MSKKKAHEEGDKEAAKLQEERAELVDHLQRLQAEFDNYRKRMEAALEQSKTQAADSLLRDILPIMDNLNLALDHSGSQKEELLKGIVMVQEQLSTLLQDQGVERIPAETFDPRMHEALLSVEQEGKKPGEIVQILSHGYTRNGKVLRPAKVSVAK